MVKKEPRKLTSFNMGQRKVKFLIKIYQNRMKVRKKNIRRNQWPIGIDENSVFYSILLSVNNGTGPKIIRLAKKYKQKSRGEKSCERNFLLSCFTVQNLLYFFSKIILMYNL
jgi:hypothetical protein